MEAEIDRAYSSLSIQSLDLIFIHLALCFRRVFDQLFISLRYAELDTTVIDLRCGITAEMNGLITYAI